MKSSTLIQVGLISCLSLYLAMPISQQIKAESDDSAITTTVLSSETTLAPLTTTIPSTTTTMDIVPPSLEDDSRTLVWIRTKQVTVDETFFSSDIDGKSLHESVKGYQAPFKLKGYLYLSTIPVKTSTGQGVTHIYHNMNKVDKSITKTRYIDGMSGKKLQDDQNGQVFVEKIGDAKFYNAAVYEEDGEKIYSIFYLTDADYIQYAGYQFYPRLTDYTLYLDQDTGQEIAPMQDGYVPGIMEIEGYEYVSSEMIEKDGKSYYVINYKKINQTVPTQTTSTLSSPVTTTTAKKGILPSTGSTSNPLGMIAGMALLVIVSGLALFARKEN